MKKVLIITYYWPPSGGAGVQRWLRFSKYLLQLGWQPFILTVDPEYAAYPAIDTSLGKDIPPGIEVHITRATDWFSIYGTDKSKVPSAGFAKNKDDSLKGKLFRFIRGNFFIPDPRRGWNKYAYHKACDLINNNNITILITTSPPHSSQLIGLKLKKRFPGINWLADLRDPWTDIFYYNEFYPTFFSKKIDSWYERKVLKKADEIITVGDSLKETFSKKASGIESKIHVITNGFDETDFENKPVFNPSTFTITYVGTLSEAYPIDGLLSALSKIQNADKSFLLRFVGTITEPIRKKITSELNGDSVEFIPYAIHSEAILHMLNSSMLLLVIPDHKNNDSIITGKIFEYIASKKPILCLGPENGDAAKIIKNNNFGDSFSYYDSKNIESFIIKNLSTQSPIGGNTNHFSQKNLVKILASYLDKFIIVP
jgi:glycosyltransferase involved in cell wall biosynthesis